MAWLIGIDEAGYGPNLGPFVMTAVACRLPPEAPDADLWALLGQGVRRHGERDDGRLIVADSKLVYAAARGLLHLERTALAALHCGPAFPSPAPLFLDLDALLALLAPDATEDLHAEAWYSGATALPIECDGAALGTAHEVLRGACTQAGVTLALCRSAIVCPPRFNALTDEADSKGAALSYGLVLLARACIAATPAEPAAFVIDKHGGRNRYGALLGRAFPGTRVRCEEEGAERSVYAITGLDRPARVTFMPRADAGCFPVALASMVSKYLREALMREFNAFWQTHVPGLKPTAGYPGDAARFLEAIRPILPGLGLTEHHVWRRR